MSTKAEDYFSYIQEEIVPLYQKVKKTIIEAENFDPQRETYIAAYKLIQGYIPKLEKEKKKGIFKLIRNNILTIVISIVAGIAVAFFIFKFDW